MRARPFLRLILVASMVLVGFALALPLPTQGQSGIIIVNNADATTTLGMAGSSILDTLIANVEPRFAVQYADGLKYYALGPIVASRVEWWSKARINGGAPSEKTGLGQPAEAR